MLVRFLTLQSLMLWQGGFLFYASFVVPVGTDLLGSAAEQGRITRLVTDSLNAVGTGCLLLLLADWWLTRRAGMRWSRLGVWLFMAATLIFLAILHMEMDAIMEESIEVRPPREVFRPLHRTYLWVTTAQWAAGLVYAYLMLRAWRTADRGKGAPTDSETIPTRGNRSSAG